MNKKKLIEWLNGRIIELLKDSREHMWNMQTLFAIDNKVEVLEEVKDFIEEQEGE